MVSVEHYCRARTAETSDHGRDESRGYRGIVVDGEHLGNRARVETEAQRYIRPIQGQPAGLPPPDRRM
jgi:hypothetical protein